MIYLHPTLFGTGTYFIDETKGARKPSVHRADVCAQEYLLTRQPRREIRGFGQIFIGPISKISQGALFMRFTDLVQPPQSNAQSIARFWSVCFLQRVLELLLRLANSPSRARIVRQRQF